MKIKQNMTIFTSYLPMIYHMSLWRLTCCLYYNSKYYFAHVNLALSLLPLVNILYITLASQISYVSGKFISSE